MRLILPLVLVLLLQPAWGQTPSELRDARRQTGRDSAAAAEATRVARAAQAEEHTGAVIVTTPQDIALLDARKGIKMFEKVSVPILGVVENMSIHICSNCGHEEHIFGQGGAAQIKQDFNVDTLGQLPLDISIRQQADSGTPTVAAAPDSRLADIYRGIARQVAIKIGLLQEDHRLKFPKIVIQST